MTQTDNSDAIDTDARVRSLCQRIVADEDRDGARRDLIDVLYLPLQRVIAKARINNSQHEISDPVGFDEQAFLTFLDKKFGNKNFLSRAAASDAPLAYFLRSAANLTVDALRENLPARSAEAGAGEGSALLSDADGDSADALAEREQELAHKRERVGAAMARLSADQRLLLAVARAADFELSPAQLKDLAHKRGVSVDDLRKALHERSLRQERRLREITARIEDRAARIRRVQVRMQGLTNDMASARTVDGEGRIEFDGKRLQALRSSREKRRGASRAELEAVLRADESLLTTWYRKQNEDCAQRDKDLLGAPNWREVALLLGLLSEGADLATERRAINSITVKYRRLLKKLRNILSEGFDHE